MPFAPIRGFVGSDYLSVRPDIKSVEDPFGTGRILVVGPINADVCFLHGFCADENGDVLMDRLSDADLVAKGANLVIVSVEKKVPDLNRARTGSMRFLSGLHVDYLVEAPGGAWPTACPEKYGLDADCIRSYLEAFKQGKFKEWLDSFLEKEGPK